jgi:8-oxo-dGTP pyrophosphatase MutT (NUDIX family)
MPSALSPARLERRRIRIAVGAAGPCTVRYVSERRKWDVLDERLVDDTPHIRVSQADIELPNHVRFTQYVFRMRRCAMTAVLDGAGERMLLMRRHRFIVDRWVWELPGGYVDDGEDPAAAAVREVVEETGWRPRRVEFVMSCQPLIGNADFPQDLFVAVGADHVGEPEADEASEVRWVDVDDLPGLICRGRDPGGDHDHRCAACPAAAGSRSATSALNSRTADTDACGRSWRATSRT